MKLENIKLSKQINIYLATIFLIVIILAASTLVYMNGLWDNTASLYNHPFTVRRAVAAMEVDVLSIHKNMMQTILEEDSEELDHFIVEIDELEADAFRQLDILQERYLGSKSEIEKLSDALIRWKAIRGETIRLIKEGRLEEGENRIKDAGVGGAQAALVMDHLTQISDFATEKADEFYETAQAHRNDVMRQTASLSAGILLVLLGIAYLLRKGLLPPLEKLTKATEAINRGDFDTQLQNESTNELGILSRAFNDMSQTIQKEMEHKDHVALLSSVMFEHDTLRIFCQKLLESLLVFTDSQIGAIYFLNESKSHFEPYESIGAKQNALASFSVQAREGAFGPVLAQKELQHLTDIPSQDSVVFSAISGEYAAKEIITIPLISGLDVFSVISLASIKNYSVDSLRLVNSLVNEMAARVSSLLASEHIFEFSQKLQHTNSELEQQAKELEMQADELTAQNTELEVQKRQLDEASRLKTNFLSNMSHELRTPLNSVIALAGVLSRRLSDKIPEEEYGYLEIIERNGKNLLALINDVLDISRIEAGREEVEVTKFDANPVVAEVISMIKPQAEEQKIQLVQESKDACVIINTDVDKFRHIMQNLIGNAVKFTEAGNVTVQVQQKKSSIEIKVADTGIGIAEEHLPYIFDEFRQADGSTSRRFGGTGLGLAISKKYAHMLGGTIFVKSILDKGSEFNLILPLSYDGQNLPTQKIKEYVPKIDPIRVLDQQRIEPSEKTILLVEDNESAIIQMKDLIQEVGYKVQTAHDAGEAFMIVDQEIPDAMVLDLMMPGVDGFKVLEILRNAEPTAHIPVLILTAKHITKDELKFLKRNNIHQLIQKGDVKRAELQKAITDMLYPTPEENRAPAVKSRPEKEKPVVLVVEDNPDNMVTVKALLEDRHTVLEAVNAEEGMQIAEKYLPDLILMDIALPGISGIQAFQMIRKAPTLQHIPIVALTASAMLHDRESIVSYGFDGFIAKPIIAKEFFTVIDEVLYGK